MYWCWIAVTNITGDGKCRTGIIIIIIIIIINVLIKVTINEISCRGTLQSQ